MADEFEDLENPGENINKVEKRIKDLSEKVKLTSTERDDLAKAKETLETEKVALSKERDFFKDFNSATSKYPNANEFQEKIREKVMAGYDMEDATVSVLAKEGKLTSPPAPKPDSPAGGSASTGLKGTAEKPVSEMSRDEKRAALMDAESKGDLALS